MFSEAGFFLSLTLWESMYIVSLDGEPVFILVETFPMAHVKIDIFVGI